jgi:sec-independent protein translocase protein TatC
VTHDDIEASRAPLVEHLIELRARLIKALVAFFLAFVICYFFAADIYGFLVRPLASSFSDQEGRRLIFTAPQEAFFTYVKVAFFSALCLSFPIIAGQIYMFVAPGLYRNERRAFLPFLAATPVLFLLGAALVYYMIMPLALQFFLSFETPGNVGGLPIELETKVNEYLSLVMALIFAFGFCFQLPVAISLLVRVGILSAAQLRQKRRYAIVGVFIVAAIVTPPDPLSQISLAIPVLLLYEISIWAAVLIERQRAAHNSLAEAGNNS